MAPEKILTFNGRLGSKKVKTGCLTCKVRRVKCDESKPGCRRCTSSGRHCDGYRTSSSLTKTEHDWMQRQQDPSIIVITPERALVSLASNEHEQRSFEFYRHQTASCLEHSLDSTFWTEFILQVSYSEPAVKHALVAIGALNERLRPSAEDGLKSQKQDRNLKLALSSYNKAIQCLTKQMQHRKSDLIALLTCILFICVEFLQDNITDAITLVHQGCAILRAQEKTPEEKDGNQKSQNQRVMISRQVMPMFTRLSVLSALCGRPASLNITEDYTQEIITPFVDLRGARSSLYIIMNQGHAIVRKADSCKWLEDGHNEVESLRLERSNVQQRLDLWKSQFTQLQASLDLTKSTRLVQAISLLSMYFSTTSIWLATCLDRAQTCYDACEGQYKQIIEAAELFVNLSEGQPQSEVLFTFEMGLIPPLYFTAKSCRHPVLRRQAVSLMQRAPGKEGMWDRAEMIYVVSKVISMEEGGDFNAIDVLKWPHEISRLHDVEIEREGTYPGQRKTVVKYISKPCGLDSPWHVHKEYLDA